MTTKKIKILYMVLEMDLGGLQRVINILINKLDRDKFEPQLCCLDYGGVFYQELESRIPTYILNRKPGLFDKKLFWELLKIIKREKIDVIHSNNGCTFYAALAGRLTGVKHIIHTDHGRLVPDRKGAILEDRYSSFLLDDFVGVSDELTKYLENVVKVPVNKLTTIINGVDTNKFCPVDQETRNRKRKELGLSEEDFLLGAVCRLDPIKNLEFLIECMPAITKSVPGCKAVIVGDGPSKQELSDLSEKAGVDSCVLFTGQRNDIESIMPVLDVYVSTSLSEGTSMTILEAMSAGLPVVASAVGGNIKLVDDSNGRLFPLNDHAAFTGSVIKLSRNSAERSELGQQSRDKVLSQFSLDRMVKQYEELYCSRIRNRP